MCLEKIKLIIPNPGEFDLNPFIGYHQIQPDSIKITGLILSEQFVPAGRRICRCGDIQTLKDGSKVLESNTIGDIVHWLEVPMDLNYNKYFKRYIAECCSNSYLAQILKQQYEDIDIDTIGKDTMIRCSFHTDNYKLYFKSNIDTICGVVIEFSIVKSEVDTVLSVFSGKENKEEKEMSKELFGKIYGPVPDGVVAMDITGQLVIKPFNGKSYKRFDDKTGKMVDMLDHVFKLNNRLAYILPVNIDTITTGDIIVVGNKEFYVVKNINKDGNIKGINLRDSTMLDIIPELLVGSDISFVPKVINLLKPGTLDPMLMMMVLGDEENATMDTKTAMIMLMGMNNSGEEKNNMNMMLPMLLMDKKDGNVKDMMLSMMIMNQSNGMDMNNMLPLLLGDDKDNDSNLKDLVLIMMMNNNQNGGNTNLNNMMLPLMLMDKNSNKKDMLLMMMLQKQDKLEHTMKLNNKNIRKEAK